MGASILRCIYFITFSGILEEGIMNGMIVILHNIRSLHNVGAIFRSADALGVERIYLSGITPSPLDRFKKVRSQLAKTALGAEETVPWEKIAQTNPVIKKLKKDGYKVWAVEQDKKSIPYHKAPKTDKVVLILGSEVDGLPSSILKNVDKVLEIPMLGMKESLNVAVSFGIVGFHIRYGR